MCAVRDYFIYLLGAELSDEFVDEFECFGFRYWIVRDEFKEFASAISLVELDPLGRLWYYCWWCMCVVCGRRWSVGAVCD